MKAEWVQIITMVTISEIWLVPFGGWKMYLKKKSCGMMLQKQLHIGADFKKVVSHSTSNVMRQPILGTHSF